MTHAARRRIAAEAVAAVARLTVRPAQVVYYTAAEIDAYATQHPHQFEGQLWERCRCGAEPVYMPTHRCPQCIMRGAGQPRWSSVAPMDSVEPDGATV